MADVHELDADCFYFAQDVRMARKARGLRLATPRRQGLRLAA
jgi:hypothetical protein